LRSRLLAVLLLLVACDRGQLEDAEAHYSFLLESDPAAGELRLKRATARRPYKRAWGYERPVARANARSSTSTAKSASSRVTHSGGLIRSTLP